MAGISEDSKRFFISGTSAAVGVVFTNPLDVVKVRMQIRLNSGVGLSTGPGMFGTLFKIFREEGFAALMKGTVPGVVRSYTYGSMRLGSYEPVRDYMWKLFQLAIPSSSPPSSSSNSASSNAPPTFQSQIPFAIKLSAGGLSGAVAAFLTNPLEMIKVRAQTTAKGESILQLTRKIVAAEGALALWNGVTASMQRSAILTASQMACYDQIKHFMRAHLHLDPDRGWAQLASVFAAGWVTTTATSPSDVVKTRMMNQRKAGPPLAASTSALSTPSTSPHLSASSTSASSSSSTSPFSSSAFNATNTLRTTSASAAVSTIASSPSSSTVIAPQPSSASSKQFPVYKNTFDCFRTIVRTEGVSALFKGWSSNYARQGPQTMIILYVTEVLRAAWGMSAL